MSSRVPAVPKSAKEIQMDNKLMGNQPQKAENKTEYKRFRVSIPFKCIVASERYFKIFLS